MNDSSVIRIGQNTKVSTLAGRILDQVRKAGYATLETVGAGPVNQAVKAVARARETTEGNAIRELRHLKKRASIKGQVT
jgi:stage V sporulation protein SpoVS